MKDYIAWILIVCAVGFASFHTGRYTERNIAAERVKLAVEKQAKLQVQNELEVRKMGDVARCSALNGKLLKSGECK